MNDSPNNGPDNELEIAIEAAMFPALVELYLWSEEQGRQISSLHENMRVMQIHVSRTIECLRKLNEALAKEKS